MGRHKAAVNCDMRPWLSAKRDCREQGFIQVGYSLFESKAFNSLKPGAQMLYLRMAKEAKGRQTVTLSHSRAVKYHGIASTSFDRYITELCEAGFITLEDDDNRYQYAANVYRFSNAWKANPAPQFGDK